MNLFSQLLDPPINLLPQDGEANYHGVVFSAEDADYFLNYLTNHIAWKNDAAIIFNKGIQAFAKSIEVPDAMFHMAQCYLKGGDPKAAQKVCEACIEKYSKHRWRDTAKKRAEYIKANQ